MCVSWDWFSKWHPVCFSSLAFAILISYILWGFQILVFASEWDDHMFAHMLEDQDDAELMSLATGQSLSVSSGLVSQEYHHPQQNQDTLNDSLLAQLTQQELDSALETDVQLHEDWFLAHDLEKEQQRLKEEQEFKKLQVL